MNNNELTAKAYELRRNVLELIYRAKAGHFGGDFSVMDIMVALYYVHMSISPENASHPDRDRFILSKGHCAEALYAVLADCGFFPKQDLETFGQFGSLYIGHPNNKINGIEVNTGSLGHGLPVAVGMALAGKIDCAPYHVYVVMGDGELAEGSVWEGAMAAGHYQLNNLIAIIDRNRLQISGDTEHVMAQNDLRTRWSSFGWRVLECNGNDMMELNTALTQAKSGSITVHSVHIAHTKSRQEQTKSLQTTLREHHHRVLPGPTVIIANTTKGFGFSQAENNPEWHHKVPNEQEYLACAAELEQRRVSAL